MYIHVGLLEISCNVNLMYMCGQS